MKRRRDASDAPECITLHSRSASGLRSSSNGQNNRRKRARRVLPSWGGERIIEQHRLLGNYNRRPGYTAGGGGLGKYSDAEAWRDQRLELFQPTFFLDADVLDVGCGAGYTTILIAERYSPRRVVGIDIDRSLIANARLRLVERTAMLLAKSETIQVSDSISSSVACPSLPALPAVSNEAVPLSLRLVQGVSAASLRPPCLGHHDTYSMVDCDESGHRLNIAVESLRHVKFCRGDFLGLESDASGLVLPTASFDIVLCLGVTKWIHLNNGDEGILRLFSRLNNALRPGGRLVLESQPWSSYKKRCALSPHISRTYAEIKMRPDTFIDILLGGGVGGGFASLESTYAIPKAGVARNVYVLRKS